MKNKIIFKCFIPSVIKETPIKKIKPGDFKWFKEAIKDFKNNKPDIHTSKCPGIISIMNTGWIQYAYQNFTIETNGNLKDFIWTSDINQKSLKYGDIMNDYIHYHTPDQLEKFKNFQENTLTTVVKIQSPWVVYIPEGYSLLSMPIPYNDDVRFTAATGFLKGVNFCNIQLYWHKLNSKEIIKKGTPLCQYVLVKDNKIDFEMYKINKKDVDCLKQLKVF
jgi:hypothetical protein